MLLTYNKRANTDQKGDLTMASILYSCFGTTDPVRGMRDGGLMHILRFYRPETVYLFLTPDIVLQEGDDRRMVESFA